MSKSVPSGRLVTTANRHAARDVPREDTLAWLAGFAELFVWLLLLKSYLLQLYIIPTGSMAETLAGEHAVHTCQNCGKEYQVGFNFSQPPDLVDCPNCHFQDKASAARLVSRAGDRIVVHGWNYEFGGSLGPRRWDVVVFKNPNEPNVNYIKRLIGLPGETIEIIDGDVWVKGPDQSELTIARKTRPAQAALWTPVYEHDYRPRLTSHDRATPSLIREFDRLIDARPRDWRFWTTYRPRWEPVGAASAWRDTDTRVVRFDGIDAPRQELQFATSDDPAEPGMIADWLGYNAQNLQVVSERGLRVYLRSLHAVTDVRVCADVTIESGTGFVELAISKYADRFAARLYADGRVTLEHVRPDGSREPWGEHRRPRPAAPARLSIGHADYEVVVELDDRPILRSPDERYTRAVTPQMARERAALHERDEPPFPTVRLAAEAVRAQLAHVRIDRDGYYSSDVTGNGPAHPRYGVPMGNGVMGSPITLRSDAYFVCGDNSTQSLDARCWKPPPTAALQARIAQAEARGDLHTARSELQGRLGPQLRERYERGEYQIGTVAADQMLGRAFLVYWPGFMPEIRIGRFNILPDLGRVRWIH